MIILIIVNAAYYGSAISFQEFSSRERCEFAKTEILSLNNIQHKENNRNISYFYTPYMRCIEK